LRNGPDTAFSSLGLYDQGVILDVIGKEPTGQWLQVRTPDDRVGWMSAERLRLNIALADVPIVEAPPTPTLQPTRRPPTPRPQAQPQPTPVPPPPEPPTPEPPTVAPPTPEPPTVTPTEKKKDRDPGCRGNCPPEE
jgi:hypothetical protein